jgi:hypothetical protein
MTVNEYLNQFIQLSRYATNDVNNNETKQDTMRSSFSYSTSTTQTFSIENKLKEMEKDGKRKMGFLGQYSGSNTKAHFS